MEILKIYKECSSHNTREINKTSNKEAKMNCVWRRQLAKHEWKINNFIIIGLLCLLNTDDQQDFKSKTQEFQHLKKHIEFNRIIKPEYRKYNNSFISLSQLIATMIPTSNPTKLKWRLWWQFYGQDLSIKWNTVKFWHNAVHYILYMWLLLATPRL